MIYFLLKFNLPTNSYFFATDDSDNGKRTEVHKSHICVKWNMRKMQMLYLNSFEI